MPYKIVKSIEDFERYTEIWLPQWIEKGYEIESYIIPGTERYLLFDHIEEYGTVEMIPYHFDSSPINRDFPFNCFAFLKNKKVVEFDKLAIKQELKSIKKFYEVLAFLVEYSFLKDIDYYIALVNPYLYHICIGRFQVPITKLVVPSVTSPYIPIAIDVKKLKESHFSTRILKRKENKNLV